MFQALKEIYEFNTKLDKELNSTVDIPMDVRTHSQYCKVKITIIKDVFRR